jgi:hypothetical protein
MSPSCSKSTLLSASASLVYKGAMYCQGKENDVSAQYKDTGAKLSWDFCGLRVYSFVYMINRMMLLSPTGFLQPALLSPALNKQLSGTCAVFVCPFICGDGDQLLAELACICSRKHMAPQRLALPQEIAVGPLARSARSTIKRENLMSSVASSQEYHVRWIFRSSSASLHKAGLRLRSHFNGAQRECIRK